MAREPENQSIEASYKAARKEQSKFDYSKVKNMDVWGAKEVASDHPELDTTRTIPKARDASEPQFQNDKMGKRGVGDVPNNWIRGGGAGQAEGKPSFDKHQIGDGTCGRAATPQPPKVLKPLPAK